MKKITISIIFILGISLFDKTYGQYSHRNFPPVSKISTYHLEVGYYKTAILIFPAAISGGGIDLGSNGIIAKVMPGVDNILKVKANTKDFSETNLTVVTNDGNVYPFTVFYSDNPPDVPLHISKQPEKEKVPVVFHDGKLNTDQINNLCREVANKRSFLHRETKSFKIKLKLQGIYVSEGVVFFQFNLKNKSNMGYQMDFSRFYIQDKKRLKRTARQEKELQPLQFFFQGKKTDRIEGGTNQTLVMAFPQFTIADHKNFIVQFFEKNGDRNLSLKINGQELVKAHPLSPDNIPMEP